MELKGRVIREEYFPYLVENGFDDLGILLWVDYGKYWKVILKSKYANYKNKNNIKCGNFGDMVKKVSSGEFGPNCFC
jgi:hypothetical protein